MNQVKLEGFLVGVPVAVWWRAYCLSLGCFLYVKIYLRLTNTRYVYGTSAFSSLKMNECSFQDTDMQKYILHQTPQPWSSTLSVTNMHLHIFSLLEYAWIRMLKYAFLQQIICVNTDTYCRRLRMIPKNFFGYFGFIN